ncbi:hypothetical protein F4775DRAFT_334426 [Biscogniauxia sp. FL1348]|nr:hypothetical protein F4775DRAFT_334426 [Biscogniauxia sp. FL1348]
MCRLFSPRSSWWCLSRETSPMVLDREYSRSALGSTLPLPLSWAAWASSSFPILCYIFFSFPSSIFPNLSCLFFFLFFPCLTVLFSLLFHTRAQDVPARYVYKSTARMPIVSCVSDNKRGGGIWQESQI